MNVDHSLQRSPGSAWRRLGPGHFLIACSGCVELLQLQVQGAPVEVQPRVRRAQLACLLKCGRGLLRLSHQRKDVPLQHVGAGVARLDLECPVERLFGCREGAGLDFRVAILGLQEV